MEQEGTNMKMKWKSTIFKIVHFYIISKILYILISSQKEFSFHFIAGSNLAKDTLSFCYVVKFFPS